MLWTLFCWVQYHRLLQEFCTSVWSSALHIFYTFIALMRKEQAGPINCHPRWVTPSHVSMRPSAVQTYPMNSPWQAVAKWWISVCLSSLCAACASYGKAEKAGKNSLMVSTAKTWISDKSCPGEEREKACCKQAESNGDGALFAVWILSAVTVFKNEEENTDCLSIFPKNHKHY